MGIGSKSISITRMDFQHGAKVTTFVVSLTDVALYQLTIASFSSIFLTPSFSLENFLYVIGGEKYFIYV